MIRKKVDRKRPIQERQTLIGMIISKRVLQEILPIYKKKYFATQLSRRVAALCMNHFKKFGDCPGVQIGDILNLDIEKGKFNDEADIAMIKRFLTTLSKESERLEQFNDDVVIETALDYFRYRSVEIAEKKIGELKEAGKADEASQMLSNFREITLNQDDNLDFGEWGPVGQLVSAEATRPLFKIKGAFGQLINGELLRENFIAFLGPEKIGKTWRLMDLVLDAVKSNCNVGFVQCGDMTKKQQTERLLIGLCKKPRNEKFTGEKLIPVLDCYYNQIGDCDKKDREDSSACVFDSKEEYRNFVRSFSERKTKINFIDVWEENPDHVPCSYCKVHDKRFFKGAIWWRQQTVERASINDMKKAHSKVFKGKHKNRLKLSTHPNSTVTVNTLESLIEGWSEREDWFVDVLVVDYPDIMAVDAKDYRHGEHEKWKGLRRLSQKYKCLVIVVTQADSKSYGQQSLTLDNFSEDKRKYSEVTSFYSLNQTPGEKAAGIIRIGCLLSRNDDFDSKKQAKVLQHLSTGRTHIQSYF